MNIRMGYVSTALSLWESSPSRTMTFKRYGQLTKEDRDRRLLEITKTNLENTRRILYYNTAHEIQLYRLSSSIVPLATHPEVNWDFVTPFKSEWKELGDWINRHQLRVSFHPNQFTLFTSGKPSITENSVKDMTYHYQMLEAMGVLSNARINIHVGGAYGDKDAATKRFYENIISLPKLIKQQMTLENDDKTYTTNETLAICQTEGIPLVFDYHHDQANLGKQLFHELLPAIFATWDQTGIPPKIHISSPKSEKAFRSHSDYVDLAFITPLLLALKEINRDVDFMIEAKAKDLAMLKLIEDISKIRGVKRVSGGMVTWK